MRPLSIPFAIGLAMLSVFPAVSRADLKFEAERQSAKASVEQERLDVSFDFTNNGEKAIRILQLDSSCGCLDARTDRQVYAPGESGVLTGTFTLGSLVGEIEKVIYVLHSASTEKVKLSCAVSIPEVMRIEPKVVRWDLGEKVVPKKFTITVLGDDPINVTGLESTRPQFTYELKTLKEGREYELSVTPANTEEILMAAIKITTDSPVPKYQRQMAFTAVSKPAKPVK